MKQKIKKIVHLDSDLEYQEKLSKLFKNDDHNTNWQYTACITPSILFSILERENPEFILIGENKKAYNHFNILDLIKN